MTRRLLLLTVLSISPMAGAESSPRTSPTPAWLPRAVLLGTFARAGTLTPQARLQWSATLVQDRVDALIFVVEGGGGWGFQLAEDAGPGGNARMGSFYEHMATAGLGYRSTRPSGFHWGFHVVSGPLFYGAQYEGLAKEERLAGLLEGRAQMGFTLGAISMGVSLGYAEPYSYRKRSVAAPYLGGMLVGLFTDWR